MYIKKDELLIRESTEKDAGILCAWWNDGKVMEHAGFPHGLGITREQVEKQLREEIGAGEDAEHRVLIIEYKDRPIGEMSFRRLENNTAQIGIKICEEPSREKGLGTRLLRMFINSLFHDCGFEKIILDTNLKNKRAQHVYEKLGFKKIRVNIDAWKNQVGELQSSVDYELGENDFIGEPENR